MGWHNWVRLQLTHLESFFDIFAQQISNVFVVDFEVGGVNEIFGVFSDLINRQALIEIKTQFHFFDYYQKHKLF